MSDSAMSDSTEARKRSGGRGMGSAAALIRPGIITGAYPQREDIRDSWLDRTAARLYGQLRQHFHGSGAGQKRFVADVNSHARRLMDTQQAEINEQVRELRKRLYGAGLQDPLIAEAFAQVREVAQRRLGMRHHDEQLLGGYIMLRGMVAEMETGEGKTLTATLTACTAAMAGVPVHIVTVNDFLVERDANWMRPLYEAMGLTVGTITEGMSTDARRAAYACDITYCTNKQLAFDYLKDRLLLGQENRRLHMQLEGLYHEQPRSSRLLMRGLCFAIVDEADSVLVDEARTPLIISNRGDPGQEEASYLSAIQIARKLHIRRDFTIRSRERQVELTDFGRARIKRAAGRLGGIWAGQQRREELVKQALVALHIYQPDRHYIVKDDKILIIDEYTGRVMPDRAWERGLHQLIEVKESCPISGRQETLARISFQRFFRRYLHLAGMTGTAQEISAELYAVYRLNVVRVPTHRPVQRLRLPDRIHVTAEQKWLDVVDSISAVHKEGRPVLVGTRSVADSEHLGCLLAEVGLEHRVLNARQDQEEAEIVAAAGQVGRITVATNMAGRGTDIRLAPGVAQSGGLHVLATERHDARRIDRQLFGRCGRQGDPGSYQAILSLEDEVVTSLFGLRPVRWFLPNSEKTRTRYLPIWFARMLLWFAQGVAERHHGKLRQELLRLDDNQSDMLAFSGRSE